MKRGCMGFKPMEVELLKRYVGMVEWTLEKGSIDWNLYSESGNFICSIKIVHGHGKKSEVSASSVRKVQKAFKERGLIWPPKKKLKKS